MPAYTPLRAWNGVIREPPSKKKHDGAGAETPLAAPHSGELP